MLLLPWLPAPGLACEVDPGGAPVVEVQTTQGTICIRLFPRFPSADPNLNFTETVDNFLGFVNRGDYDGSFVHRSVPGFVIQGGGFRFTGSDPERICPDVISCPTILNEFAAIAALRGCAGPGQPGCNVRGTVAMARGSAVDSASSQWFVNMSDANVFLDTSNEGFTIFGEVISGLAVADAINGLPRLDGEFVVRSTARGALTELPLASPLPAQECFDPSDVGVVLSAGGCDGTAQFVADPGLPLSPLFLYFVSPPCFAAPVPCPGGGASRTVCAARRDPQFGLVFAAGATPQPADCDELQASDLSQTNLSTSLPSRVVELTRVFVVPEPKVAWGQLAALGLLSLLQRRRSGPSTPHSQGPFLWYGRPG